MQETNKSNTYAEFPSNTKMVQFYLKELLGDDKPHSTAEIFNYVHKQARGIGIEGKRLTDETIRSAIWYGIRRNCADYEQISKGFYQNKFVNLNPLNTDHPHKQAIYFLGEQARFLTQDGSKYAEIFQKAAEFLIEDDENLTTWLSGKMDVKPSPDSLQDYDTKEFEGKEEALNIAINDLTELAKNESIPSNQRDLLENSMKNIADFYGMEDRQNTLTMSGDVV